jgi:hypothetical protein
VVLLCLFQESAGAGRHVRREGGLEGVQVGRVSGPVEALAGGAGAEAAHSGEVGLGAAVHPAALGHPFVEAQVGV